MAEGEATGRGSGGTGTRAKADEQVSGTHRLKEELGHYVEARLQVLLDGLGDRLGAGARRLGEAHVSPRGLTHAVARGGKKLGAHLPSGVGALTSTASHAKETASHAKDTVVGKAKQATGQGSGQSDDTDTDSGDDADTVTDSGPDKGKRSDPQSMGQGITIIEDIDVGVPVREAYGQWTQFQEFDRFAKGVVGVEQEDDITTRWHVKVGKSDRRFRGMITEQVPDERIAWTSTGNRGTTQGVVTFHPITENLTKVLLVLRYFPQGPVEEVGSWVRSQGPRARLDLKLYRTFVMMRGEATGGWRGEIRGGEVVREPEDAEEDRADQEEEPEDEYDEEEDEDQEFDEDEGPEDRYQDEEPADDERGEDAGDNWEEDEEEDEDREPDDRNDDTDDTDEQPRPKRRRRRV
ncbi:SRPBCC family protein [Streptomyces sp. Marseille-Q5077]|uniref:SRPBCC family protein n=1 Tax=Streptomyces sp. Marseille-Q5077 TaxID=3418995 RepID=UPI003CFFDD3C